jgi:hypothetical protein
MYGRLKCQEWGCMPGASHVGVGEIPGMRIYARYNVKITE